MSFRYRKLPVVIEAFEHRDDHGTRTMAWPRWVLDAVIAGVIVEGEDGRTYIKTLEGDMLVSDGDFIIRGVNGELYPCKPDIFAKTYAPAADNDDAPMGLDHAFQQVLEFHQAFDHPVASKPTMLSPERVKTRSAWMDSETQEFRDAPTVVDQADAMIDLIYFALGTLVEMGVRPQPLMDIVHVEGNMKKLHLVDGKLVVVKREDGKVVKPDGWVAPEPLLALEIERQLAA